MITSCPTSVPGLLCSLQVIQLTRDLLQESLQAEAAMQGAGEVQEPAPKKQRREICLGPPLDSQWAAYRELHMPGSLHAAACS